MASFLFRSTCARGMRTHTLYWQCVCVLWWCMCSAWISGNLGCEFPPEVQNLATGNSGVDTHSWRGRITNQNSGDGLAYTWDRGEMRVEGLDDRQSSYTRRCIRDVSNNKYVVSHEEGEGAIVYLCMQLVMRAPGVLQLLESSRDVMMSEVRCDDELLGTIPWIILDKTVVLDQRVDCGVTGGYDITLFDRSTKTAYCNTYAGEVRVESDCTPGAGLTFLFRTQTCVPTRMYMYVTQRTHCIAAWTHNAYQFTLLKHDLQDYLWVLRRVNNGDTTFVAHLFTDIVADSDNPVPVTNQYIQMTMMQSDLQGLGNLCEDEYEICQHGNTCNIGNTAAKKIRCPRTCGWCNTTEANICRMNRRLRGDWLEPDGATGHSAGGVTINETAIVFRGGGSSSANIPALHCVQFGPATSGRKNNGMIHRMFVSVFDNGCRPQYTCAHYTHPSSSILFIKLSQPRIWPLIEQPTEDVSCQGFSYTPDATSIPEHRNKLRNRHFRPLVSNTRPVPVECDLSHFAHSELTLSDGRQCSVSIEQPNSQDGITLDLSECGRVPIPTRHMCLEYLQLTPSTDQILVTRSDLREGEVLCWVFPHRQNRQNNNFFIVEANHCNEAAVRKIRKGRLEPMASFTRARRAATTRIMSTVPVDDLNAFESDDNLGDYVSIVHEDTPPGVHDGSPHGGGGHHNGTHQDTGEDLPSPYVVGAVIFVFLAFQIPCLMKC